MRAGNDWFGRMPIHGEEHAIIGFVERHPDRPWAFNIYGPDEIALGWVHVPFSDNIRPLPSTGADQDLFNRIVNMASWSGVFSAGYEPR